jgi:phage-related minor tail protein
MNGNGDNYEVRLTRIENIVEALAGSQRQLLTAQVLLTEQLEKTNRTVELVDKRLGERIDQLGERMDQLSARADLIDGQIEALVKIVDGMIRNPGRQ